jgi:hypothetical protein
VIAAALGTGYLLGFSLFLIEAIGPDTPGAAALPLALIAALPLALIAALFWPLVPAVPPRRAVTAGLVLLVAAIGIALWARLDPIAATVPPYSLKS